MNTFTPDENLWFQEEANRIAKRKFDLYEKMVQAKIIKTYQKEESKKVRTKYLNSQQYKERLIEYNQKPEVKARCRASSSKYISKIKNQSAADQFFIMAGAAEALADLTHEQA